MWISLGLLCFLIGVWLFPSGPECPNCHGHLTTHLKEKTNLIAVELKLCAKCYNKWDFAYLKKENDIWVDHTQNYIDKLSEKEEEHE